ncbi:hypothetical protein [Tsuneonella mangrovi]|uniref:hypothetical protein n=1 Tax=Tsuneonella mangrovi TaxID=1982042 RepID=UPI001237817D|nr:hypothetical protein [Tsuneonella mangrovi]
MTEERLSASPRAPRNQFFARAALVMLGCVLISFPMTYYAPVIAGSRHWPLIVHIHGLFFFSWMFLYAWQTRLAATGRVSAHRELGLAGVALSAIMIPLAVSVVVVQVHRMTANGTSAPLWLPILNLMAIATFAGLMIASIASVTRHKEWHRRFTYAAALVLVQFAGSRLFSMIVPPGPDRAYFILLVPDLVFLGALFLHDRRTLGHVHPATKWIAATVVPLNLLGPTIAQSIASTGMVPAILHLSG